MGRITRISRVRGSSTRLAALVVTPCALGEGRRKVDALSIGPTLESESDSSRTGRFFWRASLAVTALAGALLVFHMGTGTASAKTASSSKPTSVKPKAAPTPQAPVAKQPQAKTDSAVLYTIKNGDSLSSIAHQAGVSVSGLTTINAIKDIHKITAGKQILVPVNSKTVPSKRQADAKVTVKQVKLPDFGYQAAPTPGGPLPAKLLASPDRMKLRPVFAQAAKDHKVPLDLLQAMAWNESGWQNGVKSSASAVGIGQLIPDTIVFVNTNLLSKPLDPKRADHNINMSAAFLRYLLNETNNDPRLALASYYQGLNSVRTRGLYGETVQYVRTVLAVQRAYF